MYIHVHTKEIKFMYAQLRGEAYKDGLDGR